MADPTIWLDKQARTAFETKAKERLAAVQAELQGQAGVVAIEPESGDFFVGATLGKANRVAFAKHPDTWVYFVRLDDPKAAIALPTW